MTQDILKLITDLKIIVADIKNKAAIAEAVIDELEREVNYNE